LYVRLPTYSFLPTIELRSEKAEEPRDAFRVEEKAASVEAH
jgi:hypothetical protein